MNGSALLTNETTVYLILITNAQIKHVFYPTFIEKTIRL